MVCNHTCRGAEIGIVYQPHQQTSVLTNHISFSNCIMTPSLAGFRLENRESNIRLVMCSTNWLVISSMGE